MNEIINELKNENQNIKEEFKESKLKDSKLNEYLEEKKMEQKLEDNNKISELKNEIKKLTKSNIEFSGLPTLFQDKEKKDNKVRTFAPAAIDKEIDEKNEYLNINLSGINNLFDTVKKNIEKKSIIDIGDNKSINFNDIIDFSKDITDGKINNFNKEKKYNEKFKDIEKNLENKKNKN